jgi:hypothetical protein
LGDTVSRLKHSATTRKVAGSTPNLSHCIFSYRNPYSCTMALGFEAASNRNEYREDFLGVKRDRRMTLITSPPSLWRLSGKCGSLDVSKPYRPSRPGTGIVLLLYIAVVIKRTINTNAFQSIEN